MDLEQIFKDIRELEEPVKRVTMAKAQVFGNDYINIYFLRSGFEAPAGEDGDSTVRYYYVLIENQKNPELHKKVSR